MELTVLHSILHDDLKPWLLDTTDKKKFIALVKTANAVSPGTYAELQTQLKSLLSEYPVLKKAVNENAPSAKADLRQPFYEMDLPPNNDAVTRFYSLLIKSETLRVSNLLLQQVAKRTVIADKRFIVKQALRSARVLAKQVARELKNRDFISVPDANSEFSHFVLFTLKQMLTALFFDIQEQHKNVLSDFETEENFYQDILIEPFSGTSQLQPTGAFFEFQIQSMVSENNFSAQTAIDLLTQIHEQGNAKLQTLQTALGNLVFLHSQPAGIANLTFAQLTDAVSIAQQLSLAKKSITDQIQLQPYGHERLNTIQIALDELDYIQFTTAGKLSIPQVFNKWLQEQKEIYTARFSEKFPVNIPDDTATKKNGKASDKLSFGFSGDKTKLQSVVSLLQSKIELLNDTKTSTAELLTVLTAKDLKTISGKIYIGCETVQFSYIIDKLSQYFNNLKPKAIEKSDLFFSKGKRKIKAQNLYSNKIQNPKNKEDIDKILNQLQ